MTRDKNIVGPIIQQLREQRQLTQAMLVARLNLKGWDISRETLAKIETKIRWVADFELVRLAQAVGADPGDVLRKALKHGKKGE